MQGRTALEAGGMATQKHLNFAPTTTPEKSAPEIPPTAPVQAESAILAILRQQKIVATTPMRHARPSLLRGNAIMA